ncbi:hypothetical protein [Pseudocolwellia sp. HL-MZ7]|uniref:hypothetical protein n=1 Tax=Pseudocolwellia sp. HL-MZ7 TaxID=3400627 RepID=UPI003CF3188C
MRINKCLLSGIIIFALNGCAQIAADMEALSGLSALSSSPSEAEVESAKTLNSPIAISAINAERNFANGIDVSITYKNIDESRIVKYATFKVIFKNRVNDLVFGEISGKSHTYLQATGPFKPNEVIWGGYNGWSNVFYHTNASQVEIVSLSVEFMNGDELKDINIRGIQGGIGIISQK